MSSKSASSLSRPARCICCWKMRPEVRKECRARTRRRLAGAALAQLPVAGSDVIAAAGRREEAEVLGALLDHGMRRCLL